MLGSNLSAAQGLWENGRAKLTRLSSFMHFLRNQAKNPMPKLCFGEKSCRQLFAHFTFDDNLV